MVEFNKDGRIKDKKYPCDYAVGEEVRQLITIIMTL